MDVVDWLRSLASATALFDRVKSTATKSGGRWLSVCLNKAGRTKQPGSIGGFACARFRPRATLPGDLFPGISAVGEDAPRDSQKRSATIAVLDTRIRAIGKRPIHAKNRSTTQRNVRSRSITAVKRNARSL